MNIRRGYAEFRVHAERLYPLIQKDLLLVQLEPGSQKSWRNHFARLFVNLRV